MTHLLRRTGRRPDHDQHDQHDHFHHHHHPRPPVAHMPRRALVTTTTPPPIASSAAPGPARPTRSRVVAALARGAARRLVRHPVLVLGLLLSALAVRSVTGADWSGARYSGYLAATGGLLWAVSVAAAHEGSRARARLAEDAPVRDTDRALGGLLGGVALVGAVAVLLAGAATWLRLTGGLDLGDEPGRTLSAHYTLPELLQPVLAAALGVALGVALGRRVGTLGATAVLSVVWFVSSGLYWVMNAPGLRVLALIQTMPVHVPVGDRSSDPRSLPSDWLLGAPNEYSDTWVHLVVSPSLAAWHDVYLLGLTLLAAAAAVPGRTRRLALAAGTALVVLGVGAQLAVMP
ncbi:hypothetical protein Q9R32_03710 [Actinotalea sp. AC32]|nr:hypothetical protein [Actinotalea sp. AC32]